MTRVPATICRLLIAIFTSNISTWAEDAASKDMFKYVSLKDEIWTQEIMDDAGW